MDFVLNMMSMICFELKNLIVIIIVRWSKYVEFWCSDLKVIYLFFKWIVIILLWLIFCGLVWIILLSFIYGCVVK